MTDPTLPGTRPVIGAPRPATTTVAEAAHVVPTSPTVIAPPPAPPRLPLATRVGHFPGADWTQPALEELVHLGVSDVHFNMDGKRGALRIEARLDGELERVAEFEGPEARTALNRLKTNAKIDTSSARVPNDGRFELDVAGEPYRVRAVALPLFNGGEKVVLRLPSVGDTRPLDSLGFTALNLDAAQQLLAHPAGMTLIAGPMGEGKTTTAHAALLELGTNGRAVITVEDPVERILDDVEQIEVNEETGSGFGDIMRYLVRADFDVLFIGEIRDAATAAAAVRMAKAGRRVIATIHASDNVTALLRLIELSQDSPLSVLDAVSGVISQRLVRRSDSAGRLPIHEVLVNNEHLTDHLVANRSMTEIRHAATATSTTFSENLQTLVGAGLTSPTEIRRVLGHDI